MTPTAAEKLLAMLDDGQAVESLTADEVRADLALLGLDPAPSIAFAKALAAGHGTPGGRLLGGIDAAEDAEDEIARIESADIDEVRAKIPGGSAAAIAAEAHRRAGAESNVVGIQRRRRSRVLVWGGPFAGIAASLLVIFVGYEVLTMKFIGAPPGMQQATAPQAVESESTRSDGLSQPRDGYLETLPLLERSAPEADAPSDAAGDIGSSDTAEVKPKRRQPAAPPPAVASGNEYSAAPVDNGAPMGSFAPPESRDADDGFYRAAPAQPVAKPQKKSVAGADHRSREVEQAPAAKPVESSRAEEGLLAKSFADRIESAPSVVAVLLVDADRVPESIKSKNLPAGRLAERLDEARRVAAGRDVIALIALETPDGRADFVQVTLAPGLSQQLAPPAPIAGLLGTDAAAYDFIALPAP